MLHSFLVARYCGPCPCIRISPPILSKAATYLWPSLAHPSSYFTCVSSALVLGLLFVPIRCLGRIMRLSASAYIVRCMPRNAPQHLSTTLPTSWLCSHPDRLGAIPRSWEHVLRGRGRRYQHVLGRGSSDLSRYTGLHIAFLHHHSPFLFFGAVLPPRRLCSL